MMDDEPLFSRAELCSLSNAPEDAAVFWIRQGLLLGSQRSVRAHLRFNRREVMLAALLNEMRRMGLNVAAMRAVTYRLRFAFDIYDQLPKVRFWMDMLDLAPADLGGRLDELQARWGLENSHIEQLRALHVMVPSGRSQDVWLAIDFYDPKGSLVIWVDHDGAWQLGNHVESVIDEGARSALVINTGRVLTLDWPQPKVGAT